ncbi:hypothetical protein M0802_008618 [Mischocyttarus mexicanus]|nr:hypothetical protein M0802_008618 [Mischocyttarus mexicanus]
MEQRGVTNELTQEEKKTNKEQWRADRVYQRMSIPVLDSGHCDRLVFGISCNKILQRKILSKVKELR